MWGRAGQGMAVAAMVLSLVAPGRAATQVPPDTQSNQIPAQGGPQRDLEVLRRLEEEYLRAEMGLRADGSTASKADILSNLGRHQRRREPYLITATNMREHLFGDTACLTYTKVYTKPGSQAAYSENVLHVLTRRNGVWRLQLSSPLPAAKP
jgi:hypothetical protein